MSAWDAATQRADVVILTALRLEFDAVLAVDAGAVSGSTWEMAAGPRELPVAFRSFFGDGGRALRVVVAVSADMGAAAAVHALLPLVEALQPRCVAMCGVCAGPRGKTGLGDVVAAERLYVHDTGKQLPDRVQQDLTTYKLRDDWKAALEALNPVVQFRDAAWFQRRPLTTEWREHRALMALRDSVAEPWKAVEPELSTAAWKRIVDTLREREVLAASGRKLTAKGEQAADDLLFAHQGALPDLSPAGDFQPFRLHVGAMGSGARVIEDESIWRFVSQAMRKTLGIDMEAAVLGELVHRVRDRKLDALVMKGVMDFADHGRDDHFKEFAARASAECLLWFLRQQLGAERSEDSGDASEPRGQCAQRSQSTRTSATPMVSTARARSLRRAGECLDYTIERQRHAGFVGRTSVLAELDRLLLDDDTDRWVVVTGGPGMGKSAILTAWLARREAAGDLVPHHFIRRGEYGWDDAARLVGSLVAQIEARFPDQGQADDDVERTPAARLLAMLTRVSANELVPRGERLVVVIDGLDEYDPPPGAATDDPLKAFLPHALLPGVRFLCASRPRHPYLPMLEARDGEHATIDLDDDAHAADNRETVRTFWQREAPPLDLDATFVDDAVACAVGNLQHAVTLQKHLKGLPVAQRRVETLPKGLDALLVKVWQRVARDATGVRGLGILCAAREALTLDEIGAVAGWTSVAEREAFVHTSLEFLVETRRADRRREYRLHHASIREHITSRIGASELREHHRALAQKLATWPALPAAATRRYALRHALAHRVEAGDWAAVAQLAGDLGFLETKCRELGVQELETDLASAATVCGAQGDDAVGRRLHDLARAVTRESHWLRDAPGTLPAQLWNRIRRMGWMPAELDARLRLPEGGPPFLRVRHASVRESPALLRDLVGHTGRVNSCAVIPDGRRVVSASSDGTLKIWDLATGQLAGTLEGHRVGVISCAVTPDGRRVVSASHDGTLKVWDLTSGQVAATLQGHAGSVNSCAVTPDGRRVISGSHDGTLKVWDLASGQVVATLEGVVNSCAVTPDGRRVISASQDGTLKVWDLASGQVAAMIGGHTGVVNSCAVTPDGRRVVSASDDRTLKVWDLASGQLAATLEGHTGWVSSCAVTPDGRRIVSASRDGTLKVWDLASGQVVATLEGHAGVVNSCAITPDGRHVVSASYDRTLKVWDLTSGQLAAALEGHTGWVSSCAVTPDGGRVVSASADGTLKVWDLASVQVVATLEGHTDWVTSCAVMPDGSRVVSASDDETLKVWDLPSARVAATLEGHTGWVSSCAVTPDGGRVVSASHDGTLKVWDLASGQVAATLEGHTGVVNRCAITPDGERVVSASDDGAVKVWDLASGQVAATLEGHTRGVRSCAVTPDGRRVISASADGTLKVWDLASGRVAATLEGHSGVVNNCAVTADGRRVISVSNDRTLKVWDLATSACLATHRGDAPFTAVASTATVICAGDAGGTLWVFDWPPSLAPLPLVASLRAPPLGESVVMNRDQES